MWFLICTKLSGYLCCPCYIYTRSARSCYERKNSSFTRRGQAFAIFWQCWFLSFFNTEELKVSACSARVSGCPACGTPSPAYYVFGFAISDCLLDESVKDTFVVVCLQWLIILSQKKLLWDLFFVSSDNETVVKSRCRCETVGGKCISMLSSIIVTVLFSTVTKIRGPDYWDTRVLEIAAATLKVSSAITK